MKSIITLGAGIAVLAISAGNVHAQVETTKTLVHDGDNSGRYRVYANGEDRGADQYYAGIEHTTVSQFASGKVAVFGMSSYTDIDGLVTTQGQNNGGARGEMQCLAVMGDIDAAGNFVQTSMNHITNNDGDRYRNCNHLKAFPCLDDKMCLAYNYADNNNNQAERMIIVVNEAGQVLTNGNDDNSGGYQVFGNLQANGNNNGNDDFCETDDRSIAIVKSDANETIIAEGCGGNGNGRDDSWLYSARITNNNGNISAAYIDHVRTTAQEERSRPTIISDETDPSMQYVVLGSGNSQPINDGVRTYGIKVDPVSGQVTKMWSALVEEYDDNNPGIYSVQPTASEVGGNAAAVSWYRVDARRRRGKNQKSPPVGINQIVQFSPQGMTLTSGLMMSRDLVGSVDPTHRGMIDLGDGSFALVNNSINGEGPATMSIVSKVGDTLSASQEVSINAKIDGGWISNIYGNNPHTQGRNFTQGAVLAVNGEEMVVIPAATRRDVPIGQRRDRKLALEIVTMKKSALVAAAAAPEATVVSFPTPGAQVEQPTTDGNTTTGGSNPGIGGCSSTSSTSGLSTLVFFGLALLAIRRRRLA